jgi:hypothetical protein
MSVQSLHSVQFNRGTEQSEAVSEAVSQQKHQQEIRDLYPQDKVTISSEAKAQQTVASIGVSLGDQATS